MESFFSTWTVIKASGFTAYLLLFVSVSLGMLARHPSMAARYRSSLLSLHQWSGWFGFLFSLLHALVLLIDAYVPFTLYEVILPFASHFEPLGAGMGTLAFYAFAALLITSDLIKQVGRTWWRLIHYAAFPGFFLMLIHGIATGSDSGTPWANLLYVFTGSMFAGILLFRLAGLKKRSHQQ